MYLDNHVNVLFLYVLLYLVPMNKIKQGYKVYSQVFITKSKDLSKFILISSNLSISEYDFSFHFDFQNSTLSHSKLRNPMAMFSVITCKMYI